MTEVSDVKECPECKKETFEYVFDCRTGEAGGYCKNCGFAEDFAINPCCPECFLIWFSIDDLKRDGLRFIQQCLPVGNCPSCGREVIWCYTSTKVRSIKTVLENGTIVWQVVDFMTTIDCAFDKKDRERVLSAKGKTLKAMPKY